MHEPRSGTVERISIHALHEESDRAEFSRSIRTVFQSTLSMRRANGESTQSWVLSTFQSTLSMRRATEQIPSADLIIRISIHALHEESDSQKWCDVGECLISIHALHEESEIVTVFVVVMPAFQSTLSMRRATAP